VECFADAAFNFAGFRGCEMNGYTCEYGFGSIRPCSGLWCACSGQDGDDGGRCSDVAESFCNEDYRYGFASDCTFFFSTFFNYCSFFVC
jgi:hypothetical protein